MRDLTVLRPLGASSSGSTTLFFTKRILLVLSAVVFPGSLPAAEPNGFVYWPGGVPPQSGSKGARFENHALGISHRDKDGMAEEHANQTDIMVIQSGEATLVVGASL
jgi:hypothetical protein